MDQPIEIDKHQRKSYELDLKIIAPDRKTQRRLVAEAWLSESENSRYRYNVEVGKDGRKIFLLRPTWLNKGFDFQINLEGFGGPGKKASMAPRHTDLLEDLKEKRLENPKKYKMFRKAIDEVYCCVEPDKALENSGGPAFKSGLPSDTCLKVLKWLFIEQDITYWNVSGRRMFMRAIKDQVDA